MPPAHEVAEGLPGSLSLDGASFVPASKLTLADLARVITHAYEGYPLPIRMDAASLEAFCRERDVSLDRSVVAAVEHRAVGVALVATRGHAGYLAEIGIAPEARGAGLGRALLDRALTALREAGAASCALEVLEQNAPARRMYASAGFRETRALPCYRTRHLVARNLDVREVRLGEVRARARADAAWQNAFASASRAGARGFVGPDGYAVAKPTSEGILVYDLGGNDPGAVVDGLAALFAGLPGAGDGGPAATHLNVVDARARDALERRGWERFVTQVEMTRPL